ncbi:hypothetical protein [Pseudoroseomonas ludipueritiae]|uniref:Uncharacterized protein n=1 Tax=Pseudoroseomonas ludipueritiae TaxID=198093 RepID=A0ABR7R7Y5_9PROT|nr:hypothetical protein [Pseudoroseomonas ludipueritiae]MBC9177662.1 hypothetical protein [Pseudoroseomonas ludipueritiae]MCG7361429.1 hypothetical protein [Roseomonas sp. ACRSG]
MPVEAHVGSPAGFFFAWTTGLVDRRRGAHFNLLSHGAAVAEAHFAFRLPYGEGV